jgi:hypothetical protein
MKLAMLAITVGFALASAQASTIYNGDLLVGFTTQSGNDLIYDLGATSSLTNGKTWNLSSLLTGYNLNVVNWGVIGDKNISGFRTAWMTTDGTYAPTPVPSTTAWANIDTATATMYQFFPAAGAGQYESINSADSSSWNQETINGLGSPSSYISVKANPNVAGLTSATLFSMVANGSAVTNLGTFTLSSGGTLTFNVVVSTPPLPKIVNITRSGNTSTIFFTTTNGSFTYTLYYTNSAGLTASVTNWPASATTVTGNGLTNSLSNVTTDPVRFYRVGVH